MMKGGQSDAKHSDKEDVDIPNSDGYVTCVGILGGASASLGGYFINQSSLETIGEINKTIATAGVIPTNGFPGEATAKFAAAIGAVAIIGGIGLVALSLGLYYKSRPTRK